MRRASQVIASPHLLRAEFLRSTPTSPSVVHLRFLENKLQRELECTRRVVRVRYNEFAESCTLNRVGSGGVILIVSDKVARWIGQIEGLHAKLQLNALCQSELLEDRKIKMPEGRAIQAVTRRVSDCAEGRNNKCGWVKPLADAGVGLRCVGDLVSTRWSPPIPLKTELAKR
jgi:hypothetical protein